MRRLASTSVLSVVLGASVLLGASAAHAQSPSLDLRGFTPPLDAQSGLGFEPTTTPGSGEWNVAAWASYAHRLITVEGADGREVFVPVRHQVSLDYVFAIGTFDWLALGAVLPTVVYQTGDEIAPLDEAPPKTAIGDPQFELKANVIRPDEVGGLGLALLGRVGAPLGSERSYLGEGAARGELRVLSELRLIALNVHASAGVRLRGEKETFIGEEFGHELPWSAALSVRPQAFGLDPEGHWRWNAEFRGAISTTPEFARARQSPAAFGLSARYGIGDVSLLAGVELPLNSAVGNPSVRPVLSIGWAPRFYDVDQDGIADDEDECPELAEDRDGFEDSDGCTDFDNDDDGVGDEDDRCPKEKEDEDGFKDDDGCVDPDNDGDGVLDAQDRCPDAAGDRNSDGCALKDVDQDGIFEPADKCPQEAEDKDGFEDEDGCAEADNDKDGLSDEEDACPKESGQARSDVALNGCPNPDADGDTYDGQADKCPAAPEDFDGEADEDGCPDLQAPGAKATQPLVAMDATGALKFRAPIAFTPDPNSAQVEAKSHDTVRALAQLLNQKPEWVVLVGVKPAAASAEGEQQALSRAFALVHLLRTFTHRDEVAETIAWKAVEKQPGARQSGLGFLILDGQNEAKPK